MSEVDFSSLEDKGLIDRIIGGEGLEDTSRRTFGYGTRLLIFIGIRSYCCGEPIQDDRCTGCNL